MFSSLFLTFNNRYGFFSFSVEVVEIQSGSILRAFCKVKLEKKRVNIKEALKSNVGFTARGSL